MEQHLPLLQRTTTTSSENAAAISSEPPPASDETVAPASEIAPAPTPPSPTSCWAATTTGARP